MWRPIMPLLAQRHTVIVPDLRGAGGSAKPPSRLRQEEHGGGHPRADLRRSGSIASRIVGHDIGLMVAYAYAAQFPQATERVVLMDAFLPGIGDWKNVWLMRDLWHFHFYGDVPLALVKGRERTYFEHFWNDFAADRKHSVPEADRRLYAKAYAQPGGDARRLRVLPQLRAGRGGLRRAGRRRSSPCRCWCSPGEKAGGTFLIEQAQAGGHRRPRRRSIPGSGHWLMEEAPKTVIPALLDFLR